MSVLFNLLMKHFDTYAPISTRKYFMYVVTYILVGVILCVMFSETHIFETHSLSIVDEITFKLVPQISLIRFPNQPTIITILFLIVDLFILTVRRLHSANRSGKMALWGIIPFYGTIAVFILCSIPKENVDYTTL